MNPAYVSLLADHLWQSTLFAGMAGLLILMLRDNRARVRHWVWLTASWKFLIPFSVLTSFGAQVHWRTPPLATQSGLSVVMDEVSQPFTSPSASPLPISAALPTTSPIPALIWTIWACGFLGISCSWWIRWGRIRAVVRAGSLLHLEMPIRAVSSPTLLEPGVFGVFRPVMLLPEGILNRLTPTQLKGVIAHELCHVYHRDNLMASIHMFVETVFWFHPLVWWIGKRMVEERERACDEQVLLTVKEPEAYAQGILKICELYLESTLPCVSGVTGSKIKKRVEEIVQNRTALRLNFPKKVFLAAAGTAALLTPILLGVLSGSSMRAQGTPPRPAGPVPSFEVASLKPDKDCPNFSRSGNFSPSPGRLEMPCVTLQSLIQAAYGTFADGVSINTTPLRMEGGPSWMQSEFYSLSARADGPVRTEMLAGPMLQKLLAERFDLQAHRETREVPVYTMTTGKGGLKVQPLAEGACTPLDLTHPPAPPKPGAPLPNVCSVMTIGPGANGNMRMEVRGATMTQFAQRLSGRLDRSVINRTEITGMFNFRLEFAPDPLMPGQQFPPGLRGDTPNSPPPADSGPNLFTALQEQLGLKLESATGPVEMLVIDHAARPTAN